MKTEKYTVAMDLGGTRTKLGLLWKGRLIDKSEIDSGSATGLKAHLALIEEAIDKILEKNRLVSADVLGVGFSFAGLVDSSENRIISTNKKYDDGPDTDLVGWAKEKWNWPLFAENDARMALLGEWQYGIGKGCDNIVMVTLGTGVGSAVLIEGKLLKGKHFQAGNLSGHFTVNHKGVSCTCGNVGCVEAEASTWRLPALIQENPGYEKSSLKKEKVLDFELLFAHAEKNDELANEVLEHCLSSWGAGIVSMIHAFDPELIIMSGGLMKSAHIILPAVQKKVDKYAWTPWGRVDVKNARFPWSAALYGGEYLVRQSLGEN